MAHTLANPFYYGHFRYLSEIHEGKHKGIISKQLFDRVQTGFGTAAASQQDKADLRA